ncbi:MAG: hypothetical protein KFF73_16655 [Cyclobacteriaceae bacterium]|nr:hypothetical protein [Cyclobacteriaceae bacterium]
MEKSENKFEQAWKDLFNEAEAQPREDVWTKIDSGLANRQLSRYRSKLLIYKLLAAASIIFALGIGYFSNRDFFRGQDPGTISSSETMESRDATVSIDENEEPEIPGPDVEDPVPAQEKDINDATAANARREGQIEIPKEDRHGERGAEYGLTAPSDHEEILADNQEKRHSEPDLLPLSDISGQNERSGHDLNRGMMPLLSGRFGIIGQPDLTIQDPAKKKDPYDDDWFAVYEQTIGDEQKEEDKQEFWAGINFSSGIFNPNISYGNNSADFASSLNPLNGVNDLIETDAGSYSNFTKAVRPEETSFNSEVSYAYGLHVGYQISQKFVVRGGLSYLNSNASTNINSYIDNPASNRKVAYQALNSVTIESAGVNTINTTSEEIRMNYSYEFISLPVSLGYFLIDKKFEWMLIAGLSTDFFLKNTFSDTDGLFEPTEIKSGNDSPYNNSYLNGTVGTMFSVSFSDRYRVSLEPTYRLGLTEFTKENAAGISQPSSVYITAGISYIFR